MRTFLTLSVGLRPQEARPVFASDDPVIVDAVVRAVLDRVGGPSHIRLVGATASDSATLDEGAEELRDWVEP